MELHAVRTWVDLRGGRVVEMEDDVQNVVRDIKAISDRLHIFVNEQSGQFDIVESCLDGTDRLVFTVDELNQGVVNRLRASDHWYGRDQPLHILPDEHDFASVMDRENAALQEKKDEEARDAIRDAGERLHWALDLGPGQHSPGGQVSMSGKRKRNKWG